MMWIFLAQIALMGQKHGAPKDLPVDQWYYPVEKVQVKKSSLWIDTEKGKSFGEPMLFTGRCEGANSLVKKENCNIYYRSSLKGVKEGILQFVIRGRGKIRISVYSSAGFVSREVELSEVPDTIVFDLSRSVAITQHGGTDPLRIVFSPLTESFEIEVSNFVLKQED